MRCRIGAIDSVLGIDAESIVRIESQFDDQGHRQNALLRAQAHFDVAQISAGRQRHEGHATKAHLDKNL
jgi:hypothetical protein